MTKHGRYPRDPSIATVKDLYAWLEAHPDEWDRLQGRYVAFHKERGIVADGENIVETFKLIACDEPQTKKLLFCTVYRRA